MNFEDLTKKEKAAVSWKIDVMVENNPSMEKDLAFHLNRFAKDPALLEQTVEEHRNHLEKSYKVGAVSGISR